MKATELMIGDWVELKPLSGLYEWVNERNFIVCGINIPAGEITAYTIMSPKIDEFGNKDVKLLKWRYEDFAPIPLTPEILEKNGWYYDDLDGEWRGCGLNIGGYNPEEYTILDGRCIRYVHELQHALKLCGIERNIVV